MLICLSSTNSDTFLLYASVLEKLSLDYDLFVSTWSLEIFVTPEKGEMMNLMRLNSNEVSRNLCVAHR